jgi:hypothetical protein
VPNISSNESENGKSLKNALAVAIDPPDQAIFAATVRSLIEPEKSYCLPRQRRSEVVLRFRPDDLRSRAQIFAGRKTATLFPIVVCSRGRFHRDSRRLNNTGIVNIRDPFLCFLHV